MNRVLHVANNSLPEYRKAEVSTSLRAAQIRKGVFNASFNNNYDNE